MLLGAQKNRLIETVLLRTHKNHLIKTVLLSTHNICFGEKLENDFSVTQS